MIVPLWLRGLSLVLLAMILASPSAVFAQSDAAKSKTDAAADADDDDDDEPTVKFGAGRDTAKKDADAKADPKEKSGSKDAKDSKSKKDDEEKKEVDRDKEKALRLLTKKLGRKRDGYFVVMFKEAVPQSRYTDGGDQLPGFDWKDNTHFRVLEGRDQAADVLYDYLTEFGPIETKSRSRRSRSRDRDAQPSKPNPQRDFQMIRWFPDSATAMNFQTFAVNKYNAQKKAYEERMKARNTR
ncbi:hypothetical protein Pan216_18380 [Planctomycetes bacterium Pan216]|uniref:Uncharacterized protein n=1 Tax=Kolteria novifilia TaxID=2527975 RepID=A0A518B1Y3_9BACT|nr:hypothetical protein Pan216_18380 [Planctomycetes bacterium Pan216]